MYKLKSFFKRLNGVIKTQTFWCLGFIIPRLFITLPIQRGFEVIFQKYQKYQKSVKLLHIKVLNTISKGSKCW
jgi:hypothetical protein